MDNEEPNNVPMILSMLFSLIATVYFVFNFSGPYKWLADIQSEYIFHGSYYPKFTGVLAFILLLIPFGILMQVFFSFFHSSSEV